MASTDFILKRCNTLEENNGHEKKSGNTDRNW
jgi:hypothetical protein